MPKPEHNIHQILEHELKEIANVARVIRKDIEGPNLEKTELVKKAFESVVTQKNHSEKEPEEEKTDSQFLPEYMKIGSNAETNLVVEKLLDRVFHEGVVKVAKDVRKYPPFIQDAFHDALTQKLIKALEERNLI